MLLARKPKWFAGIIARELGLKTRSEGEETWFLPVADCQCSIAWSLSWIVIFFVQKALMISGSRVIYRWQQSVPPKMANTKSIKPA
ncbi:hypothetical protein AgCh_023464 [Apium graveolens]